MRWEQLSKREHETVNGAILMLRELHRRDSDVFDSRWTAYANRYAPKVIEPTSELIGSLQIDPDPGSICFATPEHRFMVAWALNSWAQSLSILNTDPLGSLEDHPMPECFKLTHPLELKSVLALSERIRSTLSKEEHDLIVESVFEYQKSKGKGNLLELDRTHERLIEDIRDIAFEGRSIFELPSGSKMLVTIAIEYLQEKLIKENLDVAKVSRLDQLNKWINIRERSLPYPEILLTSQLTSEQASSLLKVGGLEKNNTSDNLFRRVGAIGKYQMKSISQGLAQVNYGLASPMLWAASKLDSVEIEAVYCFENQVQVISEHFIHTAYPRYKTLLQVRSLHGQVPSQNELSEFNYVKLERDSRNSYSIRLGTNESREQALESFLESTCIKTNKGRSPIAYLSITAIDGLDYDIGFGFLQEGMTSHQSLIFPTRVEDFRSMLYDSIEDWVFADSDSNLPDSVVCPTCHETSSSRFVFREEGMFEAKCSASLVDRQWRHGCGYSDLLPWKKVMIDRFIEKQSAGLLIANEGN